jgi:hypothetical protein
LAVRIAGLVLLQRYMILKSRAPQAAEADGIAKTA